MSRRDVIAATLTGVVFAQGLEGGGNVGPTLNVVSATAPSSKIKSMYFEDSVLVITMVKGTELLIPAAVITVMRSSPKVLELMKAQVTGIKNTDISLTKENK